MSKLSFLIIIFLNMRIVSTAQFFSYNNILYYKSLELNNC